MTLPSSPSRVFRLRNAAYSIQTFISSGPCSFSAAGCRAVVTFFGCADASRFFCFFYGLVLFFLRPSVHLSDFGFK
jgi:hypothetical protein